MPTYRNISGVWKNVVPWRRIGATWKSGTLWRNISGTWKVVAGALTATAAPTTVTGSGGGGGVTNVTSTSTTATPSGGVGPYTYAWSQNSGDVMTIDSPAAATTTFTKSLTIGAFYTGYFSCTVTDTSTGLVAATNTVTCNLDNF